MSTAHRYQISTNVIRDHIDRLYDEWSVRGSDTREIPHVDGPDSGVITVVKYGTPTSVVLMTDDAVREFISDMAYQVEFMDDPWMGAYRAQCKRALASIKKQWHR